MTFRGISNQTNASVQGILLDVVYMSMCFVLKSTLPFRLDQKHSTICTNRDTHCPMDKMSKWSVVQFLHKP